MINTFDEKILDEAQQWIEQKKNSYFSYSNSDMGIFTKTNW
jgi:hypothetical protein